MDAQGRRRETSRHRSASRFAIPRPVGRAAAVLTPVLSLLPAVVALVVVQSLSPVAQRVPTGAARFDLAGAWLVTEPGALAGTTSWLTAPTLGRLQLGLLLRLLQGGQAQSVLAAAHGGMLLVTVVQAVLLWWVLRRLGAGGVAAGLATAVFGIAPIAIEVHTAVSAVAVAACWLLLAVGLALGTSRVARIAGGTAAAVAVASAPVIAIVVVPLAVLLALRLRRQREGGSWLRPALVTGAGFAAAAVLIALVMAVQAALPADAASARVDALTAAQASAPAAGAAALVTWAHLARGQGIAEAATRAECEAEEFELVGGRAGGIREQLHTLGAHAGIVLVRQQLQPVVERADRAQEIVTQTRAEQAGELDGFGAHGWAILRERGEPACGEWSAPAQPSSIRRQHHLVEPAGPRPPAAHAAAGRDQPQLPRRGGGEIGGGGHRMAGGMRVIMARDQAGPPCALAAMRREERARIDLEGTGRRRRRRWRRPRPPRSGRRVPNSSPQISASGLAAASRADPLEQGGGIG